MPLLDVTAAEVMALAGDERADARQLAEVVQRDQALATHVLRVSNSAAYAPRNPIVSLQQAVARLGMPAIREIAISISLKEKIFSAPGYDEQLALLWRHAAASGCYGKEIARRLRKNVEGAFLCALLHEVGKPVVLQLLIALAEEQALGVLPQVVVAEALADQHQHLGARLLRSWSLPPFVVAAATHYTAPGGCDEYAHEVATTALACLLADWALDDARSAEDFEAEHAVIEQLNLYGDELLELLAMREHVLAYVSALP